MTRLVLFELFVTNLLLEFGEVLGVWGGGKLQALAVYDILPSTTAVFSYAIVS